MNSQKADVIRGELTYDDKVIEKIVGLALEPINGLLEVKGGFFSGVKDKLVNTNNITDGVSVEVGKEEVAVDLDVIVEYQKYVPSIFDTIKTDVTKEIKRMTDLNVIEINVNVVDIKTKEEHARDSESLQDKIDAIGSNNNTPNDLKSVGNGPISQKKEPRVI